MNLLLIIVLLAKAQTTPPPSADGSTCVIAGTGCPVVDNKGNSFAFGGPVDDRGNQITKNGTPIAGDAGATLLWCGGTMYTQTKSSGTYWMYNGTNFSTKFGTTKPTCGAPPTSTVTGISVSGPSTVPAGGTATYTASVGGTGNYDKTVTWSANLGTITPTGAYTATPAASNDMVSATSNGDSSKVARQSVTVTTTTPPTAGCTGTVTIPFSLTINGITISGTQTCIWTLDPNTGVMAVSGCH